mmetsp:Transcript_27882/g.44830  ORF Transcript_27882/g.44830 Transcript_27882/m.44830 type:complete len:259 (-) Transcript_27882:374-1150(-)
MASLKHNKIDTESKQVVSSPTLMQVDDDSTMSRYDVHDHEHASGIHTPRRFNKKQRLIGEAILADAPMYVPSELRACDLESLCQHAEAASANDACTPRARGTGILPQQPGAPHVKRTGSLFEALRKNDIEEIQNVFLNNADAMNDYFWDNHFEPALCAAVHLKCKADIIRLLIEKGADKTMKDKRGRTAFDILNQAKFCFEAGFHDARTIATLLPPFQLEGVIGHFRYTLDLLTGDGGSALVDQREAWRREIAVLLEV